LTLTSLSNPRVDRSPLANHKQTDSAWLLRNQLGCAALVVHVVT